MLVRHADPARDAAACAAIYAPYVEASSVSFETDAPDAEQFAARIAETSARYPWLVLEDDGGRVAGYAYATQHRARAAYRWAADVAVYVDPEVHGRGAGWRLYEALLGLLRRQGLRIACAGVTLPNDASVGLHRALGFEHVGTYRAIGWKAGAWRDVAWFELLLAPDVDDGAGDAQPPEPREPREPQRL
jgi:phosphinothricin acetyltransferase